MARKNEDIYVDMNVYVSGWGKKGWANDVSPPNIELIGVESESSATGKFEIFYGAVDNMELEFTMSSEDPSIYDEMGKLNNGTVVLKNALNNGELGQLKRVKITAKGQISSISDGTIKRGEKYEGKVKMKSLYFYKKTIDGKTVCYIDKVAGICMPNGKNDMLEDARNFVG